MILHSRPNWPGLLYPLLVALLLALLALLLASRAAAAQAPVSPAHADPSWKADYWANMDLSGPPRLEREEATLDHDWGDGSPDGPLPDDHFSARWTRYIEEPPGIYHFTATSDDGIRVFVDDQLIINQWTTHPAQTFEADVKLAAGHHWVRVEYFENEGLALAKLTWRPVSQEGSGAWRGEYYDNRSLEGYPAFVRYDDAIDFEWPGSPRDDAIGNDNFSVRWTRNVYFSPGRYRFRITVDDGGRLYVNHHLLIDEWFDQAETSYSGEIYLPGGNVPIEFDFYEHVGTARARLTWEAAGSPVEEGKWRGEYYDNESLSGNPALVRLDRRIDFDWDEAAPGPGIGSDHFSVRWTRSINFDEGRYRFTTETDDGMRLYIDGVLVIDQWREMGRTEYSASRDLSDGNHTLRMEYFEARGAAFAKLSWERVDEEGERSAPVGNIVTCVPPQPANCAWIKVYRYDASGGWIDLSPVGFASWAAGGYLKIDGLSVDIKTFGNAGQPYRVEQWVDGQLVYSTGNFQAGEPTFLVRPYVDNYTPWQCSP